ncbi:hypothetical protein EVAR_7890_1 [Eumeta japonica]|uniref:Uncharacterized protein n=1 Tax=Eumeta variegata TaxID=151549 RepID=A0A4C1TV63_EUMVA|nr:hypothetical protein EVAR_7890_1 [Eumeta japonica]
MEALHCRGPQRWPGARRELITMAMRGRRRDARGKRPPAHTRAHPSASPWQQTQTLLGLEERVMVIVFLDNFTKKDSIASGRKSVDIDGSITIIRTPSAVAVRARIRAVQSRAMCRARQSISRDRRAGALPTPSASQMTAAGAARRPLCSLCARKADNYDVTM